MAKRIATNELNDRNWDEEEEEEEAGKFVAANTDILQQRTIIKAKRRTQTSASSGTGLFSSFSGFGSASKSDNSKTVGFSTLPSKPFLFGTSSSSTTSTSVSSADSKSAEMQSTASAVSTSSSSSNGIKSTTTTTTTSTTTADKTSENQDTVFFSNLKKLNESVLKWIEQHVAENPFCILTPIFEDYNDHLNKIRNNKLVSGNVKNLEESATESNLHKNGSSFTTPSSTDTATSSVASSISAPTSQTSDTTSAAPTTTTTTTTSSPWPISSISNSIFSSSNTSKTLTGTQPSSIFSGTGFSFKSSDTKPAFSFDASVAQNAPAAEEEEYIPPKPEMKEIKEEGSVYTKRCKLFYEKDKNWIDKGVGNLHVKPLKSKAQLIIRADTNLGNILLNIMLLPSMQLKKQGKKDVSFVCIPNPPVSKDNENKLIPMLLRVKTPEEADELLEELNKHKHGTEEEEDTSQ